jgi:hypothetical protein
VRPSSKVASSLTATLASIPSAMNARQLTAKSTELTFFFENAIIFVFILFADFDFISLSSLTTTSRVWIWIGKSLNFFKKKFQSPVLQAGAVAWPTQYQSPKDFVRIDCPCGNLATDYLLPNNLLQNTGSPLEGTRRTTVPSQTDVAVPDALIGRVFQWTAKVPEPGTQG